MHLATSEVTSTTNPTSMELNGNSVKSGGTNADSANNNGTTDSNAKHQPLTAESLAERTIEGLLADHPGELIRTGSPHVVRSVRFCCFCCENTLSHRLMGLLRHICGTK